MRKDLALRRLRRHASRSANVPESATEELDKFLRADGKVPDDEARRQWAKSALEATRKRAEGWRNGAAATLALVLASLAIKPGDGLM